jgi:methylamine utilization protein MauE
VTAGLLVGCLLLVGAGVAKAWRPDDTARALHVSPALVRAGAALEVVVGAGAATVGGAVLTGAVALSYAAFGGFVLVALARGWPLSSCGCFGEPDSPPTVVHVVVDVTLALVALGAIGGQAPLRAAWDRPGWGAAMVLVSVVTAGLAYLALARLPRIRVAHR